MSKNKNLERIKYYMEHASADADLCILMYRLIIASTSQDEQLELFKFFMKNLKDTDSDESLAIPSLIEIDEIVKLSRNSIKHLVDFLDELYMNQISEEGFYKKLWEFISTDYHFNSDVAKGVAMFNCLKTKKVPYMQFDISRALRMEQEEFAALMDDVLSSEYMEKIRQVEEFGFRQKTEKMSMLLNIIESCDDERMKVLLFMVIVSEQVKRQKFEEIMLRDAFVGDED